MNSLNSSNIFYQNIRKLRNKSNELIHSFQIDGTNPHILCLSKYHVAEKDFLHLTLDDYLLGSSSCRQNLQRRSACNFVKKDQYSRKLLFHSTVKTEFENLCNLTRN
jgi:hypothetical protein